MNCPYCKGKMRAGYVQGARGVIFSEQEKALFVVKNPFKKTDKSITDSLFECASPAFYCDKCDCMIWKKNYAAEDCENA